MLEKVKEEPPPFLGWGKVIEGKEENYSVCVNLCWKVEKEGKGGFPFWDSATVSRILFLVHRVVGSRLEQSNRAIESILIESSFPLRTHTPKGN